MNNCLYLTINLWFLCNIQEFKLLENHIFGSLAVTVMTNVPISTHKHSQKLANVVIFGKRPCYKKSHSLLQAGYQSESISATWPSFNTRILSQFWTVFRRWAIVITVEFFSFSSTVVQIIWSVLGSRDAVGSSKTTILFCWSSVRGNLYISNNNNNNNELYLHDHNKVVQSCNCYLKLIIDFL